VILEDQDVLGHCTRMGEHFLKALKDLQAGCPVITRIEGLGLMIGVEVTINARDIVQDLIKRGILANATGDHMLRFVPPLLVTQAEIDRLVLLLGEVIEARR
jgi:acetylornithine/succinyldiaminopimelate/putrescine aminotransferase